jgi:hypothetical protein
MDEGDDVPCRTRDLDAFAPRGLALGRRCPGNGPGGPSNTLGDGDRDACEEASVHHVDVCGTTDRRDPAGVAQLVRAAES